MPFPVRGRDPRRTRGRRGGDAAELLQQLGHRLQPRLHHRVATERRRNTHKPDTPPRRGAREPNIRLIMIGGAWKFVIQRFSCGQQRPLPKELDASRCTTAWRFGYAIEGSGYRHELLDPWPNWTLVPVLVNRPKFVVLPCNTTADGTDNRISYLDLRENIFCWEVHLVRGCLTVDLLPSTKPGLLACRAE